MLLASLASAYDKQIVENGNQPLLFMLIAFGMTFGLTRFITHSIRSQRFSWLGNIEAGDTHIHHLVWGIILLLVAGVMAIAFQPPLEVTAVVFGVGAALTLDEFALWLHLEDVYWSEKGRQSVDAVIVFALATGLMMVGGFPIVIGSEGGVEDIAWYVGIQIPFLVLAVVCFMKGKLIWGVVGIWLPPAGIVGAWRLAKPHSWWARNRYDDAKLERSRRRYKVEEEIHKPALA